MPFYFFFGLLGLVAGGLITWFFLAEHPFESLETPGGPVDSVEASLLAEEMEADGLPMDEATVVKLLELHGAYVEGRNRAAQEAAEADSLTGEAVAQQETEAERAAAAGRKAAGAEQTK
jgi:hypothetical protein